MARLKATVKNYRADLEKGWLKVDGEPNDITFRNSNLQRAGIDISIVKFGLEVWIELRDNNYGGKYVSNMGLWGEQLKVSTPDYQRREQRTVPIQSPSVMNLPNDGLTNFYLKIHKQRLFDSNFEIKKHDGKTFQKPKFEDAQINVIRNRQVTCAKNICAVIHEPFTLTTGERMMLGLGGASVYETSITLHHVYGFPYIPASSIKGVVRSWLITDHFGDPNKVSIPVNELKHPLINAELRAYKDVEFCRIFGCPAKFEEVKFDNNGEPIQKKNKKGFEINLVNTALINSNEKGEDYQGEITFFDAYPKSEITVEPDVMNPHYSEYYNGSAPPADYLKLNPIIFLAIPRKTEFEFVFGVRKMAYSGLLEKVKSLLIDALQNHGIGAKTAVGYGYMKEQ